MKVALNMFPSSFCVCVRGGLDIYFFNVYLFLRKRERKCSSREGAERERERERERETPSSLCMHSVSAESDAGLKLTNCEIMT